MESQGVVYLCHGYPHLRLIDIYHLVDNTVPGKGGFYCGSPISSHPACVFEVLKYITILPIPQAIDSG